MTPRDLRRRPVAAAHSPSSPPCSPPPPSRRSVPAGAAAATFTVGSTQDAVDASPGDGICATGASACTLRAAVMEANALPGQDTITVPAGVHALAIAPGGGTEADGDLEITSPLVVQGAGFGSTFIDGSGHRPLIEVTRDRGQRHPLGADPPQRRECRGRRGDLLGHRRHPAPAGRLGHRQHLGGRRRRHPRRHRHPDGRGRLRRSPATRPGPAAASTAPASPRPSGLPSRVTLTGTAVVGNTAEGEGGGVYVGHEGVLTLDGVDLEDNHAGGSGGGAVVSSRAALTVTGSTVSGNEAHGDGGGIVADTERPVGIAGTTVTGNAAGVPGRGRAGRGRRRRPRARPAAARSRVTGGAVSGNTAAGEGGGDPDREQQLGDAISGTTLVGNEAGAGGGGIEAAGARVALTRPDRCATTSRAPTAAASRARAAATSASPTR